MEYFLEGNNNVIRKWITVSSTSDINGSLIFSLTKEAKKIWLIVEHLLDLSNLNVFFNYKKSFKILLLLLSVIQQIIWTIISNYILFF